jgi:hypothetical protein
VGTAQVCDIDIRMSNAMCWIFPMITGNGFVIDS